MSMAFAVRVLYVAAFLTFSLVFIYHTLVRNR
jgi:hypothetical protein